MFVFFDNEISQVLSYSPSLGWYGMDWIALEEIIYVCITKCSSIVH